MLIERLKVFIIHICEYMFVPHLWTIDSRNSMSYRVWIFKQNLNVYNKLYMTHIIWEIK